MSNLIKHDYNGFPISQDIKNGYVNITEMCKVGNKLIADWIKLKSTDEYLKALESDMNIPISELLIVVKGNFSDGRTQGTWGHKLVAIEVARWISPTFAVWANTHILELMETGTTSLELSQSNTRPSTKELIETFNLSIDCIFSNLHIEPALIAGIKLNGIKQLAPTLASQVEEARQLLINSTAKESKLMTVTELGKLLNPPLSAKAVNLKLINGGWQVKNTNKKSKKDPSYLPTDKAKDHCSFVLSTDSNHTDTYNQLRWYDTILSLI